MECSAAESKLATARTVISTAASVAATVMLARSVARDLFPDEIQETFMFNIRKFLRRFSSEVTMIVNEFEGLVQNQVYAAAAVFLGNKVSPATQRFRVSKCERDKNMVVAMERGEELTDLFNGVKFKWVFVCRQMESRTFDSNHREYRTTEFRSFELCFPKKHKEMVLNLYLPHIMRESKSMRQEIKARRIFTVDIENMFHFSPGNVWKSVNLDHPATFETLALEPELKQSIVKDLDRFVRRRDYYRKVGKAWKRGYLLYGPPGTGKSSLIAAMANYLKFDVYDLELGELRRNSDLRRILVATANRSILVVEDIDCMVELQDRQAEAPMEIMHHAHRYRDEKVTLSGLLNFIDGLWSSCGDERIIIFTTNHKDKLDPALLRPGRMDVHIHMSYCTPSAFRVLANNYLGLKEHPLFEEIEEAIKISQVTPAELAEQLMKSDDDDVDAVLRALIGLLEARSKENDANKGQGEDKARQKDGEDQTFEVDEDAKKDT